MTTPISHLPTGRLASSMVSKSYQYPPSSAAVFGAQQANNDTDSTQSRFDEWLEPLRQKFKDAWNSIKEALFTAAVKLVAIPFHHILLRPALMRKLVPHSNILLLHPDQKKLIEKRYEHHPTYALKTTGAFDSVDNRSTIELQGHWLTHKTQAPTHVAVLCNGVAADWTYQLALAEKLIDKGAAVFMYNNRGHGESTDEVCSMGYHEAKDLAGAIIHAKELYKKGLTQEQLDNLEEQQDQKHWSKQGSKFPPLFVYGHSMGGATALFIPKSVENSALTKVNDYVDGIVVDSGYAQLDVFSAVPQRIKDGGKQWLESSDFAKLLNTQREVKLPLFDKTWTFGPWVNEEIIDKIADGPLIKAVMETLNDRMLAELNLRAIGQTKIKKLENVIPGQLSAEKAQIEGLRNEEPGKYLSKPLLYLYAADDSDTTTLGNTMHQNIDPINKLRKELGVDAISEVSLYGYHHNDSDIWYPFADIPKATMEEIAGKKNANLWDGMGVTTSLRRGCLDEQKYKAYLSAKKDDKDHTSPDYSEDVQVKVITDFMDSVLQKAA